MVANNPLFRGRWTAKKFGATVVDDIWPEVIFFTLIATMVVLVSEKTDANLGVSNQLLTVLGLVLGLVISFRTSSAYERYQDGRKMWTNIIVASKNLAQMIWIHVPIERPLPADSVKTPTSTIQNVVEKKTMVNLVQAFSVSVKHLLRGEQGPYYEDLYPLISFLPRYANAAPGVMEGDDLDKLPLWHMRDEHDHLLDQPHSPSIILPEVEPKMHNKEQTLVDSGSSGPSSRRASRPFHNPPPRANTFDPEAALPQIESDHPLKPARNPPNITIYDYIPILRIFRWIGRRLICRRTPPEEKKKTPKRKAYHDIVESHVPLEICLVLSNYSAFLMKNGLLQPSIASGYANTITLLQDTVSNLERICNTPLPFAYQAHLRMSLWIYLALLPFQIYGAYGVITIPGTAFASFLLLGFLEIGQEIENPFNYDLNDLDLDYFCLTIQRDLHEITAHTNPDPSEYLFTKWNQPFAPSDRRTAAELTANPDEPYTTVDGGAEPGAGSIRRTLVSGWKTIDSITREKK
ncbi:Bestrophin, RFP-TM, chloride channel-domain-containing protein [Crassisporium funariophilum]|nr:Bestrophin, RFP-TM, chloride channel-domain-containing protein [Crassisporium funariophilum]